MIHVHDKFQRISEVSGVRLVLSGISLSCVGSALSKKLGEQTASYCRQERVDFKHPLAVYFGVLRGQAADPHTRPPI
jgi:hypothetical protein